MLSPSSMTIFRMYTIQESKKHQCEPTPESKAHHYGFDRFEEERNGSSRYGQERDHTRRSEITLELACSFAMRPAVVLPEHH